MRDTLWVDHDQYIGPDRRQTRSKRRLSERRQKESAGPRPSLATLLRQIRMRVLEVRNPAGRARFCARAEAAALVADAQGQHRVADILKGLVQGLPRVQAMGGDVPQMIFSELIRAEALLGNAALE